MLFTRGKRLQKLSHFGIFEKLKMPNIFFTVKAIFGLTNKLIIKHQLNIKSQFNLFQIFFINGKASQL
jgi:hypothetical protein